MAKPRQTIADYMVIALSPALIIALVGSLCFFLIQVFYHGQLQGSVRWVMFWFVIGSVLVSRIAIEQSTQHALMYGAGLAVATWLWLVRTQPAFWAIGLVLLAVIWFSTHKLVFDCTFIDDDKDASGQGLLQKPSSAHSPGRWVIYFSLAALPLFGIGQKQLPGGGMNIMVIYLGAALGLLVTTSFLGLRRYLRQRYLRMPPAIAFAWLKLGIGVACIVLIGAVFLPRPGANEAWETLRYQIDYRLQQASQHAARFNPPGKGEGRAGEQPGGKQGEAPKPAQNQGTQASGRQGQNQSPAQGNPVPASSVEQAGRAYNILRVAVIIIGALLIGSWIIRRRVMLLEMLRSIVQGIADFFRRLLDFGSIRKLAQRAEPNAARPRFSTFSEYRNPFIATKDHALPPEQIIIYTFEAVQAWAKEQGTPAFPEETAREFCARLGESRIDLGSHFNELARLYAHAAYGNSLPANTNLEPIRELWRLLPTANRAAA